MGGEGERSVRFDLGNEPLEIMSQHRLVQHRVYLHAFCVPSPGGVPGVRKHYDMAIFEGREAWVIEKICGRLAARDINQQKIGLKLRAWKETRLRPREGALYTMSL
jgi:hypothetical protein